jgi:hypothetical protein
MRNHRSEFLTCTVCCLALTIFWLVGVTVVVAAHQSGAPMGPPPGGPNLKAEMRQREMRETMLRTSEIAPRIAKRDEKRIEAAIVQMKEDFRQIQIVRNEMVRNLLADKPLDYKLVSERVEEIHKRAERLKTFLIPPTREEKEKEEKPPVELNHNEMKGALVQLCNRIANFIENPVLKSPGTVNVEQSTKARDELLSIIELSRNISRSAERLNKTTR